MNLKREFLYAYLSQRRLGVVATRNQALAPEAAVVGIAVTPDLELIFDTRSRSRKFSNILVCPQVAFAIGWDDVTTVQYEGEAKILDGPDDEGYREIYYAAFPDGRDRMRDWDDLVHIMVRPTWIRYSSFGEQVVVEEMGF